MAAAALRNDDERVHDLTASVESILPVTETRLFVVYKINSRFADAGAGVARTGTRFNVQLNQSLPFLNFSGARWEMLVAVRSLFSGRVVGRLGLRRVARSTFSEAHGRRRHRPVLESQ